MLPFVKKNIKEIWFNQVYLVFKGFTMIPRKSYIANLYLCFAKREVQGDVVECGVWRGGMIAGIAKILRKYPREYYLFDSFEGLPDVQEIDGQKAIEWQNNADSNIYYNNCSAEEDYAIKAMQKAGCKNYKIIKGWFNTTLINASFNDGISILRLDGDWYESTMTCLEFLFPHVNKNGLIIIDDYIMWDGCSRAVHDYLSRHQRPEKIREFNGIFYIVKAQ